MLQQQHILVFYKKIDSGASLAFLLLTHLFSFRIQAGLEKTVSKVLIVQIHSCSHFKMYWGYEQTVQSPMCKCYNIFKHTEITMSKCTAPCAMILISSHVTIKWENSTSSTCRDVITSANMFLLCKIRVIVGIFRSCVSRQEFFVRISICE